MVVRRTCNAKVRGSIPRGSTFCRDSIAVSIPACHAGDPGSIPGRGDLLFFDVHTSTSVLYTSSEAVCFDICQAR